MANSKILTAEQEKTLRQPIEEYVGKIQKEIDELRKDGTAKVIMYQSRIENVKRDKTLSKGEKDSEIASCQKELEQAKAVEAQNKDQIAKLIGKAENYLKNNFDKYYNAVKASLMVSRGATPSRTESPADCSARATAYSASSGVLFSLERCASRMSRVPLCTASRANSAAASLDRCPPSPRMRRLRK